MATWQFDIFLIPRSSVTMDTGLLRLTSLKLDRESCLNLSSVDISRDSLSELVEGMPVVKNWDDESKIWGDMEGDRFDISMANNRVNEIYFRIDVRNINMDFLLKIINFALANSLVLLTSAGQILQPSAKLLMGAIRRSGAFKFVSDPKDFLRILNQNTAKDD